MHARSMLWQSCPSVRPSVTLVIYVKTDEGIELVFETEDVLGLLYIVF